MWAWVKDLGKENGVGVEGWERERQGYLVVVFDLAVTGVSVCPL